MDSYLVSYKDVVWVADTEGVIRSKECRGVALNGKGMCNKCEMVTFSRQFRAFKETAERVCREGDETHTFPYASLNKAALEQRSRRHKQNFDKMRIGKFKVEAKLATVRRTLRTHERLMALVAANDVPRLSTILNTHLKNGASVHRILDLVQAAINGVYRVRSVTADQMDLCILVLRLGGPRLAYALQQHAGLAGRTAIRAAMRCSVEFQFSHVGSDRSIVVTNIAAMFAGKKRRPRIAMADDVAVTPALDVDLRRNLVTGCCYEHSAATSLVCANAESMDAIADAISSNSPGTPHLASEAFILCIAGLGAEEYHGVPLAGLGTCKKGTPLVQEEQLKSFLQAWNENGEEKYGPIWGFGADGDGKRRIALNSIFRGWRRLPRLFPQVTQLLGLDPYCSSWGAVTVFDWRHLLKRFRSWLILTGSKVDTANKAIGAVVLTTSDVRGLLTSNGVAGVAGMFNPDDKMNVPAAQKLVSHVATCTVAAATTPVAHHKNIAMHVLQELCSDFCVPLDTTKLLSEQLIALSRLGHMAYCLFRCRSTAPKQSAYFMKNQLYHDLQSYIKAAYVLAIRGKLWAEDPTTNDPDFGLCLGQLGSDALEEVFALVRTLNHSSNFNTYELQTNITVVTQIADVMSRHPDWQRNDRRRGPTSYSDRSRIIDSMRGSIKCTDVDISKCWLTGKSQAEAALHDLMGAEFIRECWEALHTPGTNLLCPRGEIVGVTETVDDEEELVESGLLCADDLDPRYAGDQDQAVEPILPSEVYNERQDVSPFVEVDGGVCHKRRYVRQRLNTMRISGDRLRRVKHMPRFMSSTPNHFSGDADGADGGVFGNDPAAAICRCGDVVSLIVFTIVSISFGDKVVTGVAGEKLAAANRVVGKAMKLRLDGADFVWGGARPQPSFLLKRLLYQETWWSL
eukprot:GHVU01073205.1.p1 GENE.GHVU01073205.1~~GHVU01073205.1.p1  ORF type:complete len:912 (+),score=94.10 GHVU01073205.1:616-3351(+)